MQINLPTIGNQLATYAWPGGYPIFYVDGENNCLCPSCANEMQTKFKEDMLGEFCAWCLGEDAGPSWLISPKELPVAADINWEDLFLTCADCGNIIESAYVSEDEGIPLDSDDIDLG